MSEFISHDWQHRHLTLPSLPTPAPLKLRISFLALVHHCCPGMRAVKHICFLFLLLAFLLWVFQNCEFFSVNLCLTSVFCRCAVWVQ